MSGMASPSFVKFPPLPHPLGVLCGLLIGHLLKLPGFKTPSKGWKQRETIIYLIMITAYGRASLPSTGLPTHYRV